MNHKQTWIKAFDKPLAIAGPCSAESERQMMEIAEHLDKNYMQVFRDEILKSLNKPNCFEDVGARVKNWLKKVKDEFGFNIATEVATGYHVKLAFEYDVD